MNLDYIFASDSVENGETRCANCFLVEVIWNVSKADDFNVFDKPALVSEMSDKGENQNLDQLTTTHDASTPSQKTSLLESQKLTDVRQPNYSCLSFGLKDIVDLMKAFSSKDNYNIEAFISDIEDIFDLYQITNSISQVLFVKKCLTGPALTLIRKFDDHSRDARFRHKQVTQPTCCTCGLEGHKSTFCKNKDHGKKCYGCKNFGHVHANCPRHLSNSSITLNQKPSNYSERTVIHILQFSEQYPENIMHVPVTLAQTQFIALCDTGSQVTIINEKTYRSIGSPSLDLSQVTFAGIGQDKVKTLETGESVEMPPPDMQSDTITLRGEQAKLGAALTLVYSKAISFKTEYLVAQVHNWKEWFKY
ncbi:retrovirus-related Pol polyprotein from transposon 17.6 [Nephila pilipes]|uniref:Retrovirus-related Pol polyprotein from transposon 17.6 n=1 Tax=Nephila pilipes TaxID=299642 RepID=A0A8X6PGQ1_NEPPI|nr:retrovirus-related Pol polyprotein from transposon 17.6 [Nephila pilipes]